MEHSTERSLMKSCSRGLRTSDWGRGLPSSRTMSLAQIQNKKGEASGQVSECPWVAKPEPGLEPYWTPLERPENSCAAMLHIQPDRAWEDLQWRMGETPQIQVCQQCSVIPKKSQGCNRYLLQQSTEESGWTLVNAIFTFFYLLWRSKHF